MSRQQMKERGFTIIEVVLVLAIAALIFLMVFIALPALQRSQRDAARKTELGKVTSAITTYQSNNRGLQPANGQDLMNYVDGTLYSAASTAPTPDHQSKYTPADPDVVLDNTYVLHVSPLPAGTAAAGTIGYADTDVIQVFTGAKCDSTGHTAIAGSTRNAAVIILLENGLDTSNLQSSSFCEDV